MAAPGQTLREFLAEKPFTLAMSSSFFGFYAHCGMLCALEDAGLLPAKLTGSSAGALVAAAWASGLSAREDMIPLLLDIDHNDVLHFASPWEGGVLCNDVTQALVEDMLPVQTFEELRVPVGVSAFSVYDLQTRVFSSGPIAPAVTASMAVPLMFKPKWIEGQPYLDGFVGDVAGLRGVGAGERLLYHHCTISPLWSTHVAEFEDRAVLSLPGLPILHPFTMHLGPDAIQEARDATRRALDLPIGASRVVTSPVHKLSSL